MTLLNIIKNKNIYLFLVALFFSATNSQAYNYNKNTIKKECNNEYTICISHQKDGDIISSHISNESSSSHTVKIEIWRSNLKFTKSKEISDLDRVIIRPGEKKHLGDLSIIQQGKPYSYNFNFLASKGIIDAVHNDDYIYDLPFSPTEEYVMIQGYDGEFSHQGQHLKYSYDFKMPIGTSVHAMRDGIVAEIENRYSAGGLNPKLKNKANYIIIEHDDGTYAIYSHLKNGGNIVQIGDKVQKGQQIGYSGFTGFMGMPHLHVSVYKKVGKEAKILSLPIKIKTSEGVSQKLETYETYKKL
jgi:murein DD-endopeptidase MepM/ murein hydrolase activator NlpD